MQHGSWGMSRCPKGCACGKDVLGMIAVNFLHQYWRFVLDFKKYGRDIKAHFWKLGPTALSVEFMHHTFIRHYLRPRCQISYLLTARPNNMSWNDHVNVSGFSAHDTSHKTYHWGAHWLCLWQIGFFQYWQRVFTIALRQCSNSSTWRMGSRLIQTIPEVNRLPTVWTSTIHFPCSTFSMPWKLTRAAPTHHNEP